MATDSGGADAALDQLFEQLADAHPDRVDGWLLDEPGHWGFFAGQAVLVVRNLLNRSLEDPERRYVWHRMWLVLQKRRADLETWHT